MSANTSGAKIVGGISSYSFSSSTYKMTCTTSDWDYAIITFYPYSHQRSDTSNTNSPWYEYSGDIGPREVMIWNNTTNQIVLWENTSYTLQTYATATASGNTITFSEKFEPYFNGILYKNI